MMTGNQDTFQSAIKRGHSAAWDQNWEHAAENYREALVEFPDNPNALTSLGLALFELQQFGGALECYQKATVITPNDPLPIEKVARIFERQGKIPEAVQASLKAAELYIKNKDTDKAVNSWIRAISLRPDNMIARTRLAMVYERMGQKADAVAEYLATASIMQKSGDNAKSTQVVEYCLQIQPENIDAQSALTLLRKSQPLPKPTRPRGGTGVLRMAGVREMNEPKSVSPEAMDPIGEARQMAMVKLAGLLFDQADEPQTNIDQRPSPRGLSNLARGVTGNLSMEKTDRSKVVLHIGQAIDSQTQGKNDQAIEELERVLESGFDHSAVNFNLAILQAETQPQKALRQLQKAIISRDFSLGAYLLMGKIHLQANNYVDAAPAFLRALSLADVTIAPSEQTEELLQVYEAIIESQLQQSDEKILSGICKNIANQLLRTDWRQYLKIARQQLPIQAPGSPPLPIAEMLLETGSHQVIEALANIRELNNQNKLQSAMEEAYHALQLAPTYLPLHIQIGEILLQEGHTLNAINKFILVSELYNLRGEINQALRTLMRVVQLAPMDLVVRSHLIDMLVNQGRTSEAIHQTMSLANIHYQLSELEQARKTYASALRLAQQSNVERAVTVRILYKLVDIDLQRLDLRQAVRLFEQIRTLEPSDLKARAQLIDLNFRLGQDNVAFTELESVISSLENGGKTTQAIEFLNGIITERPDKLELRKRLADLFVRCGRQNEAVQHLDAIADALISAGNTTGAAAMLKAIISLNPPNIGEYQMALNQIQSKNNG